ncbi:PadR family transcriptional regulator [Nocardia thailandica]
MSLRHALLGMLADHPASGYDLLGRFRETLANVWPATQSQIYTELTKLADAGLVAVDEAGPRGRKQYALTPAGTRELRHWLTETAPKPITRNETLLRVFFLGHLTPTQADEYLAAIENRSTAALSDLEHLRDTITGDSTGAVYGRLAVDWGIRFRRMNQEWAAWARTQLPADES